MGFFKDFDEKRTEDYCAAGLVNLHFSYLYGRWFLGYLLCISDFLVFLIALLVTEIVGVECFLFNEHSMAQYLYTERVG